MQLRRLQSAASFFLLAITSAFFVPAVTLHAQRNSSPPPALPRRDLSGSERDIRALEINSRPKRDVKEVMAEINEDFSRLRVLNDEVQKSPPSGALDHKLISETSLEIKKRATRLNRNLTGLPKLEKDEKRRKADTPDDDAQVRALLASLNDTLTRFLANPVFSDMGSLDAQLAAKARRDLESIIELGEALRKGAEKLGKQ